MEPHRGTETKLITGAQLQIFSYPMSSKTFLNSNGLMTIPWRLCHWFVLADIFLPDLNDVSLACV